MSAFDVAGGDEEIVVARLDGEIDIANVSTVSSELLARVGTDQVGLVVDLTTVRYIDSAGVRMLFEVARALAAGRRRLAVVVPEESPLRRLFAVTHVDSAAPVRTTVDDATGALRSLVDEAGA